MYFNCCRQYWESALCRRAFSCWISQVLLSYTWFHYVVQLNGTSFY